MTTTPTDKIKAFVNLYPKAVVNTVNNLINSGITVDNINLAIVKERCGADYDTVYRHYFSIYILLKVYKDKNN